MNDDDVGRARNLRQRREIVKRIVRKFLVERRAHEVRVADHQQRVAVGLRLGDQLRADRGTGTRPVVDDDLVPDRFRQPLSQYSARHIGRSAGRKRHHQTYRPAGIILCLGPRRKANDRCRNRHTSQRKKSEIHLFLRIFIRRFKTAPVRRL